MEATSRNDSVELRGDVVGCGTWMRWGGFVSLLRTVEAAPMISGLRSGRRERKAMAQY